MKAKDGCKLACELTVAAAFLAPLPGLGQTPFPKGQARDTVLVVCSQCHPLTRLTDHDVSGEQWEFTLYDMIARGAPVHEEDLEIVRRYLIDNFSSDEQ
jgi:hypothetical protein